MAIYYSFFTTWRKESKDLVFRTEDGWKPVTSPSSEFTLKFFATEELAKRDFYKLLFDNPDFRIGEITNTDKITNTKTKKEPKDKSAKEKPPIVKVEMKQDLEKRNEIIEKVSLEYNKIYTMDCMKFMAQVPDNFFHYTFTSPPYNVGKRISFGEHNKIYKDNEEMYDLYEDKMTPEEYENWLFSVIDECIRVTERHVFVNIQMLARNKKTIFRIYHRYENNLKELFIWNKTIASPNIQKKIVTSAFEKIFCFSKDNPDNRLFSDANFDPKFRNVITGLNSSQNKFKELNKATFPMYLPRTFMKNFGQEGDLWFDPFSGTGTTFHGARIEKRNFIGTELDGRQSDVTEKRVKEEDSKLKLF